MPRYFLHLAYNGSRYHGWQRQPHSPSVQQTIEEVLSTICSQATEITGCGRTDTGVHARAYVAHVDLFGELPADLLRRLNRMLPPDIVIVHIEAVDEHLHARFDASHRAYHYDIVAHKDPFRQNTAWHYHGFHQLDQAAMQACAQLLLRYQAFAPFCKTKHDAKTLRCDLRQSEWGFSESEMNYYIAANRFLRGMVRLIVGACVQVGLGKLSLKQVADALDKQQPLPKPLSVPASGLFLSEVRYDIRPAKP